MADTQRIYRLLVDASQANRSLKSINTQVTSFSSKMKGLTSQLSNAASGFVAGFGLKKLAGDAKEAIEALDEIGKTADAVGIATSTLQELRFGAARSGVSLSQLDSNLIGFVKRMGELREGVGPLNASLRNYDETFVELLKNTKSQEEALALFSDRMAQATTQTERAFLANAAFGRSGVAMVRLLQDGSEGLKEYQNAAREAGLVIKDEFVRTAEAMNDAIDTQVEKLQTWYKAGLVVVSNEIAKLFGQNYNLAEVTRDLSKAQEELNDLQKKEAEGLFGFQFGRTKRIKELKEEVAELTKLKTQLEGNAAANRKAAQETEANTAAANAGLETGKKLGELLKERAEAAAKLDEQMRKQADAIREGFLTPTEQLTNRLNEIDRLFEQNYLNHADYVRAVDQAYMELGNTQDEVTDNLEDTDKKTKTLWESMQDSVDAWSAQTADAFVTMAETGELTFGDLTRAILRDLARMAVQLKIVQPLFNSIFGVSNTPSPAEAGAHGGVFGASGALAFASGAIFDKPTYLPLASGGALIGEAGPEAVLPLARDPRTGDLGLKGGTTTVNVINNSGANATVTESQDGGGTRIDVLIESAIDGAMARGRFDKTLGNIYGIKRRGS